MKLAPEQSRIIDRWLSAVETGKPDGDYSNVTRLYDGPGEVRQITYGKHQTTENSDNLKRLIRSYLESGANCTSVQKATLQQFLSAPRYSQVGNMTLVNTLKAVASDPVMRRVQEDFFLQVYMRPAMAWADANGFTLPLSALVIYDSFIQSGSIRMDLRRRFSESPPSAGGRERVWIDSYVDCRHQWLKYWGDGRSAKSVALRNSSYRTLALVGEVERGNWKLDKLPMLVNGITVQ